MPPPVGTGGVGVDAGEAVIDANVLIAAVEQSMDVVVVTDTDKARAFVAAIVEGSDDAISTFAPSGVILTWNRGAETMFGYSAAEAIGKQISLTTAPEDLPGLARTTKEILAGGRVSQRPGFGLDRAGRRFDICVTAFAVRDMAGAVAAVALITRDVTMQKQAERDLQRSEEMFRQLAENITKVFWMLDLSDSKMIYVSPAFEKVWGQTCESLYRNPKLFFEAIIPEDRAKFEPWEQVLSAGRISDLEYRIRTPDGQVKWIHDRAFPIHDAAGKLIRVAGIAEDVSERKRNTEELLAARAAADAANQAKSRWLANVSHEIRTPMNGVLGIAELLAATELSPAQKKFVGVIESSGKRLLTLIDDILDLSKMEAHKVVLEDLDFDLADVAEDLVQTFRVQLSAKSLQLRWRIASGTPSLLRGDRYRLQQILNNLVSNAIKFTEHGQVSLNVDVANDGDGKVCLRFAVADTGIGIGIEQGGALFTPFAQADTSTTRKYGGTGLGLAICKQLAELLGGEIGFERRDGAGATFWFTAVFSRQPVPAPASDVTFRSSQHGDGASERDQGRAPVAHRVTASPRGARILIADDNETNRMVLLAQVENLGCTADAVTDGAAAVSALESGAYDLVLMDCEMPTMDGYEATRRIREAGHRHLPIIAVTACATPACEDKCRRAGMTDFLSKPVDLQGLAGVLARWLGGPALPGIAAHVPHVAPRHQVASFDAEALLTRTTGDRRLAESLVKLFVEFVPSQLDSLRQHLVEADGPGARLVAHALNGAAATISADRLHGIAREIEAAAGAGEMVQATSSLYRAVEEFEGFKSTLNQAGWPTA